MKVLSIGNSFSQNAHSYLPKLMKWSGNEITLANLYIGGCSLERHWNNVCNDAPEYDFQLYEAGSVRMTDNNGYTVMKALDREDWDIVTLQQCSTFSGIEDSYYPYIEKLAQLVREKCPDAKIGLHQTWAYQQGYDCADFDYYGRDQQQMYDALRPAYKKAFDVIKADFFLPVGDAFQLVRKTEIGDNITGDGRHGNRMGEFLAGAVWYEMLTGDDVTKNGYRLPFVCSDNTVILKAEAHKACIPYLKEG